MEDQAGVQRRPLSWAMKEEEEYAKSWDAEGRQGLGRSRRSRSSHRGNHSMQVRTHVAFSGGNEKSQGLAGKFLPGKGELRLLSEG